MTKNSLFVLVVIIVVGFGIWFSKFGQELKRTQEIVNEKNEDTQRLLKRRTAAVAEATVVASPDNSLRKSQLQQEIQDLGNQLQQETQKLDSQRQFLEDLRKHNNPEQTDINYRNQISSANQEIQYLNEALRGDQYNETDVQREAQRLQNEQDSSLRLYRDQMDQNIRDQEALIKRTQDEIYMWDFNFGYTNLREERLQYLHALLEDQTQQLQNMRTQKLQISAQALAQTQTVQQQARQVASDNADNRQAMQEQISALRDEIQRLEYAYRQTRFSQASNQDQLQQAQKNIQGQRDSIQAIQDLIKEKQAELNRLQ